jgi:hypothetical protein
MAQEQQQTIERLRYTYLIKVVDRQEWAESIRDGKLRLGSIGYYRGVEGDRERGDPDEGADIRGHGRHFVIKFGDIEIRDAIEIAIHRNDVVENNFVFCAYSLFWGDAFRCGVYRPPSTLGRFGKYAVSFNAYNFVARASAACREQGIPFCFGFVEYMHDDYHGEWGIFRKRRRYAHQQEFRFAIGREADPATPHFAQLDIGGPFGATVHPLLNGCFKLSHPCPVCKKSYITGIAAPERRRTRRIRNKIAKRFGALHHFQRCMGCGAEVKIKGKGLVRKIVTR